MGVLKLRKPLLIQSSASSISCFGDSSARGFGASDTAHRWVNLLAASLGAGTINNQGVDGTVLQGTGNQANNGVGRYAAALLGGNKTDLVFIAYGVNDGRFTGTPPTTVPAFTTDYQTIISGLLAGGYSSRQIILSSPIFVTVTGYTIGGPNFAGANDAIMLAYRDAVFALAQTNNLPYADIYSVIKSDPATLIGNDNLHPNDAGNAAMNLSFRAAGTL